MKDIEEERAEERREHEKIRGFIQMTIRAVWIIEFLILNKGMEGSP